MLFVDGRLMTESVGGALLTIRETARQLLAQVDKTPPLEPDKITQLLERVNQIPGVGWGLAGFAIVTMAVAAISKLTGNLDKIFSLFRKYFSHADVEWSISQSIYLRQQFLKQMKTEVALRLEDSLHNLVRIDLEQEEQRHQVGRRKKTLVKAGGKKNQPFRTLIQRGLAVFRNRQAIEPIEAAEKTYNIFHRPWLTQNE
ncbi:MAG: hypothetical protein AAGL17_02905 [Cyanobacteria bacterium J06576_12]